MPVATSRRSGSRRSGGDVGTRRLRSIRCRQSGGDEEGQHVDDDGVGGRDDRDEGTTETRADDLHRRLGADQPRVRGREVVGPDDAGEEWEVGGAQEDRGGADAERGRDEVGEGERAERPGDAGPTRWRPPHPGRPRS